MVQQELGCVLMAGWARTSIQPSTGAGLIQTPTMETHYFRAFTLGCIISLAQQKNLNAGDAFDWYIDDPGRGCLCNAVEFSFEQGVMSYAQPVLFDKDSPECDPAKLGLVPARVAPSSAKGESPEFFVYEAIPIPAKQNVTVACDSLHACGDKLMG